MKIQKYSPVIILSVSAIVLIILFTAVAASGFRGLLPGSFFYKNKNETDSMFFKDFLKNLIIKLFLKKDTEYLPGRAELLFMLI